MIYRFFKEDLNPDFVSSAVAHVARWDPYNLYGIAHVRMVGSVLCLYPAQHITTAVEELNNLL